MEFSLKEWSRLEPTCLFPLVSTSSTLKTKLSENAHLPFDRLTVLSKVEGLTALSDVEGSMLSNVEASKGCVTLIPRHCGVLLCTPHSSGFRPAAKPAGWTFSISSSEAGFLTASTLSSKISSFQKVRSTAVIAPFRTEESYTIYRNSQEKAGP
jgi:hypothetical protein